MPAEQPRMWQPSPSPEESWSDASGANEDGEWPVKAIVGEEIRLDGTSRYEVRWDNWHRLDGSNTTWETERFERTELIRKWNRTQKRLRHARADADFDMRVSWPDDAVHKRFTDHRSQAYEEKLERKRRACRTLAIDWDAEIEDSHRRLQEPEIWETNSKLRARRGANPSPASGSSMSISAHLTPSRRGKISSPVSTASSHDLSVSAGPVPKQRGRPRIDSSSPSVSALAAATPTEASRKEMIVPTSSSAESSKELGIAQSMSITVSQPTLRGRISSAWNKAAKEALAARVRISPHILDHDLPCNLRKFKYLEKGYVFRDGDLRDTFDASRGLFTKCDCTTCSDRSHCPCRDLSEIYDLKDGTNFPAYVKGLFTFEIPRGIDVIECNKYCGCDLYCGNRVAQRPRSVAVEIFDTKRYGWGVRALDDIPLGKVLGTYTGMLIRREEAKSLPKEHQGYLFDLDSTEVMGSQDLAIRYTVDSYEYGNWTRFVNHSCSPNMQVFCVVYDTIPYVNMPYVAFVASTDILAGTELTIDYHPHAEENKKGKGRARGEPCGCESEGCRGWLSI